jgi:hypothetical protein
MKQDESQDQAPRSAELSLERAVLRNIRQLQSGSHPASPYPPQQQPQPLTRQELRSTIQVALDIISVDLDLDWVEEYEDHSQQEFRQSDSRK